MSRSIGLELGPSTVRAVVLERDRTAIQLIASAQAPVSDEGPEALTTALRTVRDALTLPAPAVQRLPSGRVGDALASVLSVIQRIVPLAPPVIAGVPGHCAIVTTLEPLIANRRRGELAVRFELQQRLPYNVDQAAWHYHWWSVNGSSQAVLASRKGGPPFQEGGAVVAAMKDTLLEERLSACSQGGWKVHVVQVTALAAVNVWWRQCRDEAVLPSVLLYGDGSYLEWILISADAVHVVPSFLAATIPIPVGRSPDEEQRNQLLASLSASWQQVQQQGLASVSSSSSQGTPQGGARPTTVWLVGAIASWRGFPEELQQTVGCAVRAVSALAGTAHTAEDQTDSGTFALACGLALQGLGMARLPMNLLAERMRIRRAAFTARVAKGVSVGSAVLALLFAAHGMATLLQTRQQQLRHLTEEERTYQLLRPEVRALRIHQTRLERRLQQLRQIAQPQGVVGRALQGISEALPDIVWLTKIELTKTQTPDGLMLDGLLEGFARSFQGVTQLMDRLKADGWETVKPLATKVTTDPATGKELVAFTIKLQRPLQTERREAAGVPAPDSGRSKGPRASRGASPS